MQKVTATDGRPVSLGAVMTGGAYTMQREREKDDFYPTPPEATEALMRYWQPGMDVWEPCAGDGALADIVKRHDPERRIYMTDINPRRPDIGKLDFLKVAGAKQASETAIVTNPPFKHAEKFIRKGFELGVKKQAMLLKSTYWHAKGRTPLFREFRPSHVLALNWRLDFMNIGRPVMECVWVVFDQPCSPTTVYDVLEHPGNLT